jgi:predicted amidophosphoribosyltransferase
MQDPRGICPGCGESAEPHLTACLACGRDLTLTTTTQSTFEPAGAGNRPHFTDFRIVKTLGPFCGSQVP